MRVLLIDNHDSFTHNLAHQIAGATGREPVVVAHDEPGWRLGALEAFDAVVISPGPGSPERPADFGICREVIERGRLPLLGVCLGHQGIAAAHGARVVRAPEPVHGRCTPVLHDGTGLFAGLPRPLEAVRYHSLAVAGLPGVLEPLAHAPDGVLMALRHRERPQWGVQFHPESIGTAHGDRLMANFTALAAAARPPRHRAVPAAPGARPAAPPPPAADPEPPAPRGPAALVLLTARLGAAVDAEAAFDTVFRTGPHPFWLDSSRAGAGPGHGRFSVLGNAGGPLARVASADVASGTVTVASAAGSRTVRAAFWDWLAADLRERGRLDPPPELPFDFAPGWVGYLGYELKAQCGGRAAHPSPGPDAVLVFADRAVVVDHVAGETYLLALAEETGGEADGVSGEAGGPAGEDAAADWLGATARRLTGLRALPEPEPGPALLLAGPLRARHGRRRYLELVGAAQAELAAGESYEVCLTNRLSAPLADPGPGTAWRAYRAMRRAAPAPFGAFLSFGGTAVLGTSPERFLRVAAGLAQSRPIKGTRPRGATPQQDAALRAELAACEKDRAENLMIVDLVRNDLGRVAEPGSVLVTGLFEVETYDTVHQLVSTVRARLRPGATAVDAVRSAFPPGSMTGAPKRRTMEIIDRLEGAPRGVYSGAVGWFALTGAADLSVVIRTAVLAGGEVGYGTGGAVVALSDPVAEFEETAVKAAPLLALTGTPFPERGPGAVPGVPPCGAAPRPDATERIG